VIEHLSAALTGHPYPLLFATVSGADLYGFPSSDSDYDLRGAHILPTEEVLGLFPQRDTVELSKHDELELDLVTHDVQKFFALLLKSNGYVLEQLYSPLVVQTSPEHEELKWIGKSCITRNHAHHYFGFAENQWRLFEKEEPRRVKPLLYVFRVLLTGIHLMRTGVVEANLPNLNQEYQLAYIPELIARKTGGPENQTLALSEISFYQEEYDRLRRQLEDAAEKSSLPESQTAKSALNDLLLRVRLKTVGINREAGTQCPVCGLMYAFAEPGAYETCSRCGWEDDPAQRANPEIAGANHQSLLQARTRWKGDTQSQ
jgi:predicted nucleotidyltransferase